MVEVKSEEPEFIRQSPPSLPQDRREIWIRKNCEEAHELGMTWPRFTWDETRHVILLECWRSRPEDQGEPRWVS